MDEASVWIVTDGTEGGIGIPVRLSQACFRNHHGSLANVWRRIQPPRLYIYSPPTCPSADNLRKNASGHFKRDRDTLVPPKLPRASTSTHPWPSPTYFRSMPVWSNTFSALLSRQLHLLKTQYHSGHHQWCLPSPFSRESCRPSLSMKINR